MADNDNSQKGEGNQEKNEDPAQPHRPKHIFRKNLKNDLSRSKSAPVEELAETDDTEDYISSYNYFIYYNSIKPADPRLPKPTYKPKPNLDFIKESKDKEEEEDDETPVTGNETLNINPLENLTKELNQLSLEHNSNNQNNEPESLKPNSILLPENVMNNFPKNQKKTTENNVNTTNEAPSPLDYYSQSMMPNQQNDISQQQMWNEPNLGMNQMGLGMYNPSMGALGGMVGMGMNPMNPLLGMNMNMNPYGNLQYGNMMGMNPSLMNSNMRMSAGNNQYNRGRKNGNQKKGINNRQDSSDQIGMQNPMFNNMYNTQNNGLLFPNQNSMMNMNLNTNYLNDQRFQMMQMNQGFQRNNLMQGDMNNMEFYQNMNNANKAPNKKNKKGENYVRKDVNEYKNIDEIIEKAVVLSKDHSGSR